MFFPLVRERRKDYEREEDPEKFMKKHFFSDLSDAALVSLDERFQLIKEHLELFGFLLSSETMKSCSPEHCTKFANIMGDVDSLQLKSEIQ